MNITTKFNLGQTVYPIISLNAYRFQNCKYCDGIGEIPLKGENISCPKCYGRKGEQVYLDNAKVWIVDTVHYGIIGKIDIELYAEQYLKNHENTFRYMLSSTGVGSGTLHDESRLFENKELAQMECDILNKNCDLNKEEIDLLIKNYKDECYKSNRY